MKAAVCKAAALMLLVVGSCRPSQPQAHARSLPSSIWVERFRGSASLSAPASGPAQAAQGPWLVAQLRSGAPRGWSECGSQARYRFVPASRELGTVRVDESAFAQFTVTGRFVLEEPPPPQMRCPGATHVVTSIDVGAYKLANWHEGQVLHEPADVAVGSQPPVAQIEALGPLQQCARSQTRVPRECLHPLAVELSPYPHPQSQAKVLQRPFPSNHQMPVLLHEPEPTPRVRVGHEECSRGFAITGQVHEDLARLGRACGSSTGMTAASEVIEGEQSVSEPVHPYPIILRANRCYRLQAVAGRDVRSLVVLLRNPAGATVAQGSSRQGWMLIGQQTPFCINDDGVHVLLVSVEAGAGPYAVRLWQVPP